MMKGQVSPPGWFQVCPECKTIVDYTCSCPGGWGSPAVPDGVEKLHFDTLDDADAATKIMRNPKPEGEGSSSVVEGAGE